MPYYWKIIEIMSCVIWFSHITFVVCILNNVDKYVCMCSIVIITCKYASVLGLQLVSFILQHASFIGLFTQSINKYAGNIQQLCRIDPTIMRSNDKIIINR